MIHTEMPAGVPSNLFEMIGFMKNSRGFLSLAHKYLGRTVGEVVQAIQSQTIRDLLTALMPAEFSAEALIMMLGTRMLFLR